MKTLIHPSSVAGFIKAPTSKSSMQRACALSLLNFGRTIISNPGNSNDDIAALDIIQELGGLVSTSDNEIIITSNGYPQQPSHGMLNCGESGLSLRMFTPIAALIKSEMVINGKGSLVNRPVHFFREILPLLGVSVSMNNDLLPITIKGPLNPKNITIDGSFSSQYLTGLLMAFAQACTEPVTITVNDLKSKPYIDLTLQMMTHFGWEIQNLDYKKFLIVPVINTKPQTIKYSVEGDWSSASFLLVAAAIAGKIHIEGLNINSFQADREIIDVLKAVGVNIQTGDNNISVSKGELNPFKFDATHCPDLFPPLVALAASCKGISYIRGVERLQHKESDRGHSLMKEFSKLGINIQVQDNVMEITGGILSGAEVHSHHDHRIVMACAIAALNASGPVTINGSEAVKKSYPFFFKDLMSIQSKLV